MPKLYKNALFDLIVALVALALGVVMLPVFEISSVCIDILLALALVAYLLLFLLDKLRTTRGTVFALTVIEFAVLALMVILLIIQQFSAAHIASVCQAVGIVLWLRGIVMTATLYISALYTKKPRTNLTELAISLLLVTLGAVLFAGNFITDLFLEWLICIALFITALVFAALAFLFHHPKENTKQEK